GVGGGAAPSKTILPLTRAPARSTTARSWMSCSATVTGISPYTLGSVDGVIVGGSPDIDDMIVMPPELDAIVTREVLSNVGCGTGWARTVYCPVGTPRNVKLPLASVAVAAVSNPKSLVKPLVLVGIRRTPVLRTGPSDPLTVPETVTV